MTKEKFVKIWMLIGKMFEWFENDRIKYEFSRYPDSYKMYKSFIKRVVIQNNYEDRIDSKIEWEKMICECKSPSEKSNNDNIHEEKKEVMLQNQELTQ
jgi:hypothetical protein